jgi:hypothetical protein
VLAAAMACAAQARAEPDDVQASALDRLARQARITGWARFDYFQSSNSLDGQRDLLGATLQIKALPRLNERVEAKLEARIAAPDVQGRDGHKPDAELLEGYAIVHFPAADLRFGKQIVAWGRADGLNPTDNLTPRNFLVLLPNDEDQRFGIWAARLNLSLSQSVT